MGQASANNSALLDIVICWQSALKWEDSAELCYRPLSWLFVLGVKEAYYRKTHPPAASFRKYCLLICQGSAASAVWQRADGNSFTHARSSALNEVLHCWATLWSCWKYKCTVLLLPSLSAPPAVDLTQWACGAFQLKASVCDFIERKHFFFFFFFFFLTPANDDAIMSQPMDCFKALTRLFGSGSYRLLCLWKQ